VTTQERSFVEADPRAVRDLAAAAELLETAAFRGAMTATPAVAALLRARQPLARLLRRPGAEADPETIAIARALLERP
jgi:hypothetical protein